MRILKVSIVCGIILTSPAYAGDYDSRSLRDESLKQDTWQSDRYNRIDPDTGRETGEYIQKDRWEPEDRFNIYDENNRQKGYIERDRWQDDRWNIKVDKNDPKR